jgi:hypothetical protein
MAEPRELELVRGEIALERRRLADAVVDLRAQVGAATDVKRRVRSNALVLAPAAVASGFVLFGGVGATVRYVARHGRR